MLIVRLQPPLFGTIPIISTVSASTGGRNHVDTTLPAAPTITASLFQLRIVFVSSLLQDFLATGLPSPPFGQVSSGDGDGLWLKRSSQRQSGCSQGAAVWGTQSYSNNGKMCLHIVFNPSI